MKREQLEKLGITDKAIIDAIMDANGQDIEAEKNKAATAAAAKATAEADIIKKDAEIVKLQTELTTAKAAAAGTETLQATINTLTAERKTMEGQLKDANTMTAIKLALAGKVHDVSIVAGLIDKAKIETDTSGSITKGLDDQLTQLQTDKGFLFTQTQSQGKPNAQGWKPAETTNTGGQQQQGGTGQKTLGQAISAALLGQQTQ